MSEPKSDRRAPSIYDLLALATLLAVVGAHAWFIAEDQRLPRDMGLYYTKLPVYVEGISQWRTARHILWDALISPMGWYNLLLAWAMAVLGRSPALFQGFDVLWVGGILLGSWGVARRLGGPAAGLTAIALVGATPLTVVTGRIGWIHVPETALALGALWIALADPPLARRRSVAGLAILGLLTISLRQTGFIWIAPIGLGLAWSVLRDPARRWRRLIALAAAWSLGMIPVLMGIEMYLAAKIDARERYAAEVPALTEHLVAQIGLYPLALSALGILGWLMGGRRILRPISIPLAAWVTAPLLLVGLFQAGLDNFNPLAPALAILGGWGMALLSEPLALIALGAFGLTWAPQFMPWQDVKASLGHVPGVNIGTRGPDVNNYYRTYDRFGEAEVRALLAATCEGRRPGACDVLVDQGLFYPYVEDYGRLEMFFIGDERVRVLDLQHYGDMGRLKSWDAMARYECEDAREEGWRRRYPDTLDAARAAIRQHELMPAWSKAVSDECDFIWLTPDGELPARELLPATKPEVLLEAFPSR